MTALPIIETQNGDVSAYISTNVISITDGQIFLESGLFFSGQRPAVNVGLSVSRVGGAAQTKAMKKASGSIRVDLAQYRELEIFTQFASDLDPTTKAELDHGSSLMELLKQPLSHPMSMAEEVVSLVLANHNFFDATPKKLIKTEQANVLDDFKKQHRVILDELSEKKVLSEDLEREIVDAALAFRTAAGQIETQTKEPSEDPKNDLNSDHKEA